MWRTAGTKSELRRKDKAISLRLHSLGPNKPSQPSVCPHLVNHARHYFFLATTFFVAADLVLTGTFAATGF